MKGGFWLVGYGGGFEPALRCLRAIARIQDAAERDIEWRDDVLDAEIREDLDLFEE